MHRIFLAVAIITCCLNFYLLFLTYKAKVKEAETHEISEILYIHLYQKGQDLNDITEKYNLCQWRLHKIGLDEF